MGRLDGGAQLPRLGKDEIIQRVEELLDECWDGVFPVDVEAVCDYLGVAIVPVVGLQIEFGVEAFIAADFETIYVDNAGFQEENNRYRFSVAHELGHLVLHRDYFSSRVESFDEWVSLVSGGCNYAEFQANYFAGSLLAPEEELAGVLNAKFGGSMARNYWRVGREEFERIMREVRKFFKISEQVVTRRMGEMVYGLVIPG